MRTLKFFGLMVLILSLPCMSMADISSQKRLIQRPDKDGAVVTQSWLYGEVRYQHWEDDDVENNYWLVSPTFITSLPSARALELGSRLYLLHADVEMVESEFGLGDIDIWAKYQFIKNGPLQLSGGVLLTLPTGDEAILHPKASGEVNFELYGAARYQTSSALALIGHVGFRNNSDAEFDLELEDSGRQIEGEVEGEAQFIFGGGIIYQASSELNLIGELNFASEAYEDAENEFEITGGIEYSLMSNTTLKCGLGIGFDDGSPDYELIFGLSRSF